MGYLSKNNLIQGRRVLSVSSYSTDSTSSDSSIVIPEELYSLETLLFCNLNPTMASYIFNVYQSAVQTSGEDCVDFGRMMRTAIHTTKADAFVEDDEWEKALSKLGGNQHLINRVMDPFWKDVRLSRSAKEWILFIVSSRLDFLELLDAGIRERARNEAAKQSISGRHAVSSTPSTSSKIPVAPSTGETITSIQENEKPTELC